MKLIHWLVPCVGVVAFAGYYHHWDARHAEEIFSCPTIARDPFEEYAHRDGRREAEADLVRGMPKLLGYGLPARWTLEYAEILKRDYGVEERAVAGCVVTESIHNYVGAYNEVIVRDLKNRFGSDCMEVAVKKAMALYDERHPPADKPAGSP